MRVSDRVYPYRRPQNADRHQRPEHGTHRQGRRNLAKVSITGEENAKATGFDPDRAEDAFTGRLTGCFRSLA
jgi:hypothetical protein